MIYFAIYLTNNKITKMKRRIIISITLTIFLNYVAFSQNTPDNSGKIKWLSFEEAMKKNQKEPRKIIIDVYTEWCGWCKYMDKTTFTDPNIIAYINANYYAVKLDAETTDTIEYKGKKYGPSQPHITGQRKPTHNLAIYLLRGQMSYPNLLYMDDSSNIITAIPGYKSPKDLQPLLIYFGENIFKYEDINKFASDFNKTFTDSLKSKTEVVKWLSINEALKNYKTEKKKIFISLQTPWCPTCQIMDNITFHNEKFANYLNTKTYPVRLDATTKDSIIFNNYLFINENKEHPFHQFAVTLLGGKMSFPNIVFFDENLNRISNVPGYMTISGAEPIFKYFIEDRYKTINWENFIKTFSKEF